MAPPSYDHTVADILRVKRYSTLRVILHLQVKLETTHHTVTRHHLDSVKKGSQAAREADTRGENCKSFEFLKTMRPPGDCISLWMRAWKCTLEKAEITIYWTV
ncbi:hypothetical protein PAXINDRAFT_151890 [Paxillus involutus ATCC 200175]|nr:hypothetical protein PAXINDRAFT_151890 [Paxillus involutus ATCC 200175]